MRWRSRLRTDPPFANTAITYALEYDLLGVLVTNGDGYQLDHDFAFPDRPGPVYDFELSLDLDPVWQPSTTVRRVYTASGLRPGSGFVLTIPLRYMGAGLPMTRTVRTLRGIALPASIVLAATVLAMLGFVRRGLIRPLYAGAHRGRRQRVDRREHSEVSGGSRRRCLG